MQAKAVILLLALAVAGAHAQSVGNLVGGIVDGALGAAGVDERTFFRPGRCANRRPSAPRNLEARSKNPTTVRLTWRAKDNSCVDFYEITYNAEGVAAPRTFSPLKVTDYVVDIPNLEPNTRYVFNVRAVNGNNGASSSAQAYASTPQAARCGGPPRPPMNAQTRSDSPTTLTVNWLVQENDPCIERYEVTYLMEGQTVAPRSLAPVYVTDKTVTLSGLQPDTSYNVVIAAVAKNGQRATVTTRGRTQPLCNPLRAPANAFGKQVGPRAVQLTWSNPQPACVRNAQVSFVDNSSGSRGPVTTIGNRDEQFTFANLQPGREYTFSVRYVGRDGSTGPASSQRLFLANNSQGGTVVVPGRR